MKDESFGGVYEWDSLDGKNHALSTVILFWKRAGHPPESQTQVIHFGQLSYQGPHVSNFSSANPLLGAYPLCLLSVSSFNKAVLIVVTEKKIRWSINWTRYSPGLAPPLAQIRIGRKRCCCWLGRNSMPFFMKKITRLHHQSSPRFWGIPSQINCMVDVWREKTRGAG